MVDYTTTKELVDFGNQVLYEERARLLKRAEDRSPDQATFLSHSSKDVALVAGAIRVLEGLGATVYVDKKDDTLPPYTNRATAMALRQRIKVCKKFILLATKNSKESRWVPWELGLSDGFKGSRNTAIFPGVETRYETQWAEQEYLGVYDRIVWGDLEGYEDRLWMVWNQESNTATPLRIWLNN